MSKPDLILTRVEYQILDIKRTTAEIEVTCTYTNRKAEGDYALRKMHQKVELGDTFAVNVNSEMFVK